MQPSSPSMKISSSIAPLVSSSEPACPPLQPSLEAEDFVQTYAECSKWKDILLITAAALVCIIPIICLIVSAFLADPDSEPGQDGLASEGSSTVRAFTMGWLFCLALKLRREYVGLVGSCSLLEPW